MADKTGVPAAPGGAAGWKSGTDFGSKMRRAREERGLTLRRIADVTKISVSALEALERDDISRLPGGIFSRAFVRSYAVEIGLDPEETVREFLARFPDDSVTAGSRYVAYDDGADDEPRRRRRSGVLITVLVLGLIIGAILFITTRQ
jgi:cytoskeleton protein RodZ